MTKGTFTAAQALKPTELKVGDFYGTFIDDMIKRGDAIRAAKLKRAEEEGKALSEFLKDYKIDYGTTISPFQDQYNKLVSDGIEYVGRAKMMAQNMSIPIEERRKYAMQAANYANDIKEAATFFNDPNLIKQYSDNYDIVKKNKAFGFTINANLIKMNGS